MPQDKVEIINRDTLESLSRIYSPSDRDLLKLLTMTVFYINFTRYRVVSREQALDSDDVQIYVRALEK